MKKFKRTLFIILGSLCVGLGIVGILVPLLPTTPFLVLAAWLYAQSSDRFYQWLINNRWFGSYIRNYREGLGIPLGHKIVTISLLWLTIGASCWFVVDQWWLRVILLCIAAGVTYHLVSIKNYREEKSNDGPLVTECCAEEK